MLERTSDLEGRMASTAGPRNGFDLGRVIQHAFGAILHNAASFALLALLLAGVPALISTVGAMGLLGRLVTAGGGAALDPRALGAGAALTGAGGLISLVANAVLQGAIIYGSASYLNGRAASFGDCLGAGLRRCLPLLGLMVLMVMALAVGFLFFIVPGVMMGVAWIAATPALVVERTGAFGAFSRSAELTRGRRWPIFGLLFLSFVAISIVQQVFINLFGAAFVAATPQMRLLNQLPISAAFGVITSVLVSTGVTAIYYELRVTREGIGPEAMAAVFD
jgi:hypothetical protein